MGTPKIDWLISRGPALSIMHKTRLAAFQGTKVFNGGKKSNQTNPGGGRLLLSRCLSKLTTNCDTSSDPKKKKRKHLQYRRGASPREAGPAGEIGHRGMDASHFFLFSR